MGLLSWRGTCPPGSRPHRSLSAVAVVLLAISLSTSSVGAHPGPEPSGWTIGGSLQGSLDGGCISSPTCLAFLGAARLGGGCQHGTPIRDGIEISIVELPEGAAGARALFRWSNSADVLGSMTIGWIGELNGVCRDLGSVSVIPYGDVGLFGYGTGMVTVQSHARFVYVAAERAADVRWYLDERQSA